MRFYAYRFWESFLKVNLPMLSLRIRREITRRLEGGESWAIELFATGDAGGGANGRPWWEQQPIPRHSMYDLSTYMNDWIYGK